MNIVSVASSTKLLMVPSSLRPIDWFQFADDVAVVHGQKNENQDMIIRVDKYAIFGMKIVRTRSVQYQPKLFINSQLVSCVSTDRYFKCLGDFNFQMSILIGKSELIDMMNTILAQID